MLTYLNIKNYALIEDLEIDLNKGLTTITGETGAGKSIILGAISLLAGNRADKSMLKNDNKKCIIEAAFQIGHLDLHDVFEKHELEYADETIIRREFNMDGKSRVFVNDSPAALLHLKDLMSRLLDVHSQHENLELNNKKYQLNAIDLMAGNVETKIKFRASYHQMTEALRGLNELKEASEKIRENTDLYNHQMNELNDANLEIGEQEELESELDMLSHAEEIKLNFSSIEALLNEPEVNPTSSLNILSSLVKKSRNHFKEMDEISSRMDNLIIELDDIRQELERLSERFVYDPERLQIVQDRISLLFQLQHKYHANTVSDLIEKRESIRRELEEIENMDDTLQEAEKLYQKYRIEAEKLAKQISESRHTVLSDMENYVTKSLKLLGMENSQFIIELKDKEDMDADGINSAEFLFTANKGIAARPISKVASGGELSRLMLSIKALLTSKSELPTIIFDEIDTGISGVIAEKMGLIIRDMSKTTQVLAITHLPQIAAMGDNHLVVYKDDKGEVSQTKIKSIKEDDRVKEIARLLSGEQISKEALDNAKVLIGTRS